METNTEGERGDGRKEKQRVIKVSGTVKEEGVGAGLVWLLHLPFGLGFCAVFTGEKEGRELQEL